MNTQEQKQLFQALKKVLKAKGLTYQTLGERLGMAESTVKRIFANENCSLTKLIEICTILEISLSQLTELYKSGTLPVLRISAEAEKFFLENTHFFKFLRQLSLYKSVKEVKRRNNLNTASTKLYLSKLKELNLVQEKPKNEYEVVKNAFLQLSENGELLKLLTRQWSYDTLEKSLTMEPGFFLHIGSTRLKTASISYFKSEMKKLMERFKSQGHLEGVTSENDVYPFGLCLSGGPQIVDFPNKLPNLD